MSTETLERLNDCNCWVKQRPAEEQFGLRWGAHSLSCPMHRMSKDPVDREKDQANREYGETHFR